MERIDRDSLTLEEEVALDVSAGMDEWIARWAAELRRGLRTEPITDIETGPDESLTAAGKRKAKVRWYALIPAGAGAAWDRAEGLIGQVGGVNFAYNRLTREWELCPDCIDYFMGDTGGDLFVRVDDTSAEAIAERFGTVLPDLPLR